MARFLKIAALLSLAIMLAAPVPRVSAADHKLDSFAKCLSQKNAKMYGLFWCTHCQDQKDLFGSSFVYVNYVECAVPGSRQIVQACKDAKIQHTPTWTFADGTRKEGVMQLSDLAKQTGCKLP